MEIGTDGKKNSTKIGDKDELQKKVKNEDWNNYTIVAKGNHLTHIINGTVMSEVIDNQTDKAAKTGVIALQLHQGPPMKVQFKDIEIKQAEVICRSCLPGRTFHIDRHLSTAGPVRQTGSDGP